MSIVRQNLKKLVGYVPYCGNFDCAEMPRTKFNGKQYECKCCGWQSDFEPEFINEVIEFNKQNTNRE